MTDTTDAPAGRRPAQKMGRPRDTDRTEAILAAAGELLLEVGFDNMRIQDVADRACSGTGAIYRRWSTKEALVAEAIRTMPDHDPVITDDPEADLRHLIAAKFAAAASQPDLLPGIISAMRTNPEIGAAIRERYTVSPIRDALARVVGEDAPQLDLLSELTPALILHRITFSGEPVDLDELIDDLLALLNANPASS